MGGESSSRVFVSLFVFRLFVCGFASVPSRDKQAKERKEKVNTLSPSGKLLSFISSRSGARASERAGERETDRQTERERVKEKT